MHIRTRLSQIALVRRRYFARYYTREHSTSVIPLRIELQIERNRSLAADIISMDSAIFSSFDAILRSGETRLFIRLAESLS